MRIAMIGQRGVPASSGGIERVVEQVGAALARRGHEVTVYCRPNYVDPSVETFEGMRLRLLPTIGTKHLDAIVHTSFSTFDALSGFYVLHYHALGPGLLAALPRVVSRAAVVQTVHGLDWQRAKWGGFATTVLRCGELASVRVPHELMVPSRALADHYREVHGKDATVIPNPFPAITAREPLMIRERYGLDPGRYVLFVGRLTPEKQVDVLMRAYRRVETDARLVIVGGSAFTDGYVAELETLAAADDRVTMTGELQGPVLDELFTNAGAFASPSALEGFNITLVEAISAELPIVASAIPPHTELLHPLDGAVRFHDVGSEESLARALRDVIEEPDRSRAALVSYKAALRDAFSADRIAEQTEVVYERALARRGHPRRRRRR
jgi:glycosyltransferase involved in cell wall biosynthesis